MNRLNMKEMMFFLAGILLPGISNAQASTTMYLDTMATGPNQTASFSLCISNDKPVVGFQLDVSYPSVLTYVNGSAQLTSRASDQVVSVSAIAPGVLRLIAYSVSLSSFTGTSGAVLKLDFTSGTAPGTFPLGIQNATVADSAEHNILTVAYGGLFTLNAPQLNISPPSFNFGSVPLYQNAMQTITLKNTGNIDLHISKMSINQNGFTLNDSSAVTVVAGGNITRNVIFTSSKKGTYNDTLTISSDDPSDSTHKVALSGIAFAVNELRIGSVNGRSGYVSHLPVSISNMERFAGFQFKVSLPYVARYVSGSVHLSSRATDQVVVADTTGGVLTVLAYSPSNSAFKDTNGTVLTMDFMVQGQGGSYSLSPSSALISDSTATNIMSASYSGNIQVVSPALSLNTTSIGYGSVSAKDTASATLTMSNSGSDTLMINSFSINNSLFHTSFVAPATIPPGNSDNVVILFHAMQEGAQSAQIIIRSNDSQHDPSQISLAADVFLPNVLSVGDTSGFKGEEGLVAFRLDNTKSITGFQCDVQLPSPISPVPASIQLTSRKKDHIVTAAVLASGVLRIIAYSPSLAPFSSDSGAIMYLPVTLSDTVGTFQIHLSNVVLSDTSGKNALTGTNDGTYQIRSRKITITGNLNASWNMVSVPVVPDNFAESSLFSGATSKAFYFTNKYVSADTLRNEYGYWLKFGSPSNINIVGLPIVADTLPVQAGWNLIGSISASVPVDSIIESPSGNVSSFYFGFNGGYRTADSLTPGMGYWVKVFNPGSLILQTDPNRIYSSEKSVPMISPFKKSGELLHSFVPTSVNETFLDTLNYLDVADADSFSQRLYFGRTNIDSLTLQKYELPPKPPQDAFDARFGSGRFLETISQKFDSTDLVVEVQTSRYPLAISWHAVQGGMRYYIIENNSGGTKRTQISGDAGLTISDSTEHEFVLRCVSTIVAIHDAKNAIPSEIGLEQNFPNPFNPSTIIRFNLPNAQVIDLSIFDIDGRKIQTLAFGKYSGGSHEVTFDASNFSSGVYIVRLAAEGHAISRKTVLIK